SAVKSLFGYDDALDVFGVHCVGGILGALGTGILVNPALGGTGAPGYDMGAQLVTQAFAVGVAIVWSAVVAALAMLVVKALFGGARVGESAESDGLDLTSHGERAYNG
ncbi:MAG: ammonium transporter, partial [Bauldia sp.]